jgi:hypothetical protein
MFKELNNSYIAEGRLFSKRILEMLNDDSIIKTVKWPTKDSSICQVK